MPLRLRAGAFPPGAQEMASLKIFLSALKADARFTKGLGQLELKSAQRRSLGSDRGD